MPITDRRIYTPKMLFQDLWNGNTVSIYPVSESWTLFPVGEKAYLSIDCFARPKKTQIVLSAAGWVKYSDLFRCIRTITSSRKLHFVTAVFAVNEIPAADSKLPELLELVRKKQIKVQTLFSPLDARHLIARFQPQACIA